jgi:hypothetical protein
VQEPNQEQGTEQENQTDNTESEEVELTVFAKDEFEMQTPLAWKELPAPEGIKVLLTNSGEEQIDPEKERSGFKTYLAVTKDVDQGKTEEEFVDYIKNILIDSLPEIEFVDEKTMEINGYNATALEALITQEGYNFRTLLVIIKGEGEDVWTLSFNTAEIRWESSRDLFYQVVNSFKLK